MAILNLEPDSRLEPAPDRTAFDYGLAVAKVGALAFPFLGAGVTLFDLVTAPSRGKRLNDWCEELRLRLNEVSRKVDTLTPESLATNDTFVSAFAQATQAAVRSHQTDKLEALRNAVINVAIGNAPPEDLQMIFLNLVDSFTPTHLHVLGFFEKRDVVVLERLRSQLDLADQAVRDLRDRGLINDPRPYVARNRETSDSLVVLQWDITRLGEEFLAFIKSPEKR
jgi:hypothetical protein